MFSISKFNTEYQTILSGNVNLKDLLKFIYLFPKFIIRSIEIHRIRGVIKKKNFKIEDSIIISSEERSGSTWFAEILNSSNDIAINWEPFHEKLGVLPGRYNFGVRPYINEKEKSDDFNKLFREIFELKVNNYWTTNFLKLNSIENAKYILTKTVKFSMSLPWLVNSFRFNKRPILLLRHPISVVLSQEKNFNQDIYKDYILSDSYNNDRFIQNKNYLMSLDSILEKRIAIWCLNNVSTINDTRNRSKWNLIYYENLLLNPREEFKKIEDEYDIELSLKNADFNRVSASSKIVNIGKEKRLSNWLNLITDFEKEKIQKIFNHFDLKVYTAFSAVPI